MVGGRMGGGNGFSPQGAGGGRCALRSGLSPWLIGMEKEAGLEAGNEIGVGSRVEFREEAGDFRPAIVRGIAIEKAQMNADTLALERDAKTAGDAAGVVDGIGKIIDCSAGYALERGAHETAFL